MIATYFDLRIVIAASAVALPVILASWRALDPALGRPGSLSAFYYTPARGVLVGSIVAIGVCLIVYRGFAVGENRLFNAAGTCAIILALSPTTPPGVRDMNAGNMIHVVAAVAFFLFVSAAIVWYARTTLTLLTDRIARRFLVAYVLLSAGLVVLPLASVAVVRTIGPGMTLLGLETGAIIAFAAYWALKTVELRMSAAEDRTVDGRIDVRADGCLIPAPSSDAR